MDILVETSTYALFGTHIYVSIYGDDQLLADYRARNMFDAKGFIERSLAQLESKNVVWQGDIIVPFVYHREGD